MSERRRLFPVKGYAAAAMERLHYELRSASEQAELDRQLRLTDVSAKLKKGERVSVEMPWIYNQCTASSIIYSPGGPVSILITPSFRFTALRFSSTVQQQSLGQ